MIDLSYLKRDGNYIFPCRTYDDYLSILQAAEGCSGFSYESPEKGAKSLFNAYADMGAIRITVRGGYRSMSWADFEFYESGGYGPCTIMQISDVCRKDDFGEFAPSEFGIESLLSVGGALE